MSDYDLSIIGTDDLRQRLVNQLKSQVAPYPDGFVNFKREVGTDITDANSPTNRSEINFNNVCLGRVILTAWNTTQDAVTNVADAVKEIIDSGMIGLRRSDGTAFESDDIIVRGDEILRGEYARLLKDGKTRLNQPGNHWVFILLSFLLATFYAGDMLAQSVEAIDPVNPDQIHGELRSRQVTSLSSELPARIEKIALREGFRFEKGSVLIKLDCALIKAQHEKTKAVLVATEKKYAVEKRLLELNSTGELDVQNAEAEMGKALADMEAGRVRLSKCVIRAPFSGRIVERKMGEHQFAQVGREIIRIIDDKNLEIAFIIPSHWVTWLKPGYRFLYRVNETGKDYPAKVVQRGAQVDAVSRSIIMIGRTIADHEELIPGMSGIVNIKPPNKD